MLRDSLVFIALVLLTLVGCIACRPAQAADLTTEIEATDDNPLLGGWYLVRATYGEDVRTPAEPFQFKLFGDRQFAFLMQSPSGEWDYSSTGSYELPEEGIYRETFEYSTVPEYRNLTADWAYYFRGDTLYMEGPLRLVDRAGNLATEHDALLNTMREARVRQPE